VGGEVGWMMKMSSPRTFSSIFTKVSPSGNGVIMHLPSSQPMYLQMARARGSFAVPEKTFTVYLISLQSNKILRKARGKCQPAHYQRKCLKQVEMSVKNHNSRNATVIGSRAARIAG